MPDETSFVHVCPACTGKRIHTPEEWIQFHPWAGHGFIKGEGWSNPGVANLPRRAEKSLQTAAASASS